jgi:DNA-binding CsgD family transcriptional regulator
VARAWGDGVHRVLIVDPYPLVREALVRLVDRDPELVLAAAVPVAPHGAGISARAADAAAVPVAARGMRLVADAAAAPVGAHGAGLDAAAVPVAAHGMRLVADAAAVPVGAHGAGHDAAAVPVRALSAGLDVAAMPIAAHGMGLVADAAAVPVGAHGVTLVADAGAVPAGAHGAGIAADVAVVGATDAVGVLARRLPVLALLDDPAPEAAAAMLCAGASGVLHRGAEPDAIGRALRAVALGAMVAGPGVARALLRPGHTAFPALTPREREVLERLARGATNGQIALALGLSVKTVCNHVSSICTKLRVLDRAQAAIAAREAGLG